MKKVFAKSAIAILTVLCIILSLLPMAAFAESTSYKLWVNDEQITDDHLTVTCGSGTAVYDPAAGTLTLNGAEITTGCSIDYLYSGIVSYLDSLTVIVASDSSITVSGGEAISTYELDSVTYQHVPHDLTITGSGKLSMAPSNTTYGYGVLCTGKLTITNATLDIQCGADGLWARESITLTNSIIDINVNPTSSFGGIVVGDGTITVNGGRLTVNCSKDGILLGGVSGESTGTLIVNGGSVVISGSRGIISDAAGSAVTVNGGELTISASDKAFSNIAEENITVGSGRAIVSGSITDGNCKFGAAASTDAIVFPVSTIESASDTNYVLRPGVSASFTPGSAVSVAIFSEYDGMKIDYYNPLVEIPESLENGYSKLVEYNFQFYVNGYTDATLAGTLTVPLPEGTDGATAKIVNGAASSGSNETTVSFPVTADVDASGNIFCSILVEYAAGHSHSFSTEWKSDSTNHWHECSCGEKSELAAHTFGDWTVSVQPTETTDGLKYRVCSVCGYTETVTMPATGTKGTPSIISGAKGNWVQGTASGLSFSSDADISYFIKVTVDGVDVSSENFDIEADSTIVTLHSDYLSTLSAGKHTIGIVSATGTAETTFTVSENVVIPKTGEAICAVSLTVLMLSAGISATVFAVGYTRKKHIAE